MLFCWSYVVTVFPAPARLLSLSFWPRIRWWRMKKRFITWPHEDRCCRMSTWRTSSIEYSRELDRCLCAPMWADSVLLTINVRPHIKHLQNDYNDNRKTSHKWLCRFVRLLLQLINYIDLVLESLTWQCYCSHRPPSRRRKPPQSL